MEIMGDLDRLYKQLEANEAIGMSTIDIRKEIKQELKKLHSLKEKNQMSWNAFEPGSAGSIAFRSALTEKEAK